MVSEVKKNVIAVNLMTMFVESSRGLFISTIWHMVQHCGGTLFLNGIVVSIFSVGRLVGQLLMGYLTKFVSEKSLFIACSLLIIGGNIMYILAYQYSLPYLLVASRCLSGFATGCISICRSHTAEITPIEKRTYYMGWNSLSQFCGVAFGPLLSLLVSKIEINGCNPFNPLTLPAYILTGMHLIIMIVILMLFKDKPLKEDSKDDEKPLLQGGEKDYSGISNDANMSTQSLDKIYHDDVQKGELEPSIPTKAKDQSLPKTVITIGILMYIFLNFAGRAVIALVESVGTPMYLEIKGLHGEEGSEASSMLFGAMGIAGLFSFALPIAFNGIIGDDVFVMLALVILGLGSTCLAIFGTQLIGLIVGLVMIWTFAFPLLATTILSSFSKILGSKPQGPMMGWIGFAGSVGRITMPFMAGVLSQKAIFILNGVICFSCIPMIFVYKYYVYRTKSHMESALYLAN